MSENISAEWWDLEIKPKRSLFDFNFLELFRYKDLLFLFVKRDVTANYRQTILGPLWFVIQPIITSLTFTIIFGRLANISTGGTPSFLFYFTALTLWNYFSECLTKTANTFVSNARVFGKVYFPRLLVPISIVISNFLKFIIQFFLLIVFWMYYKFSGANISLSFFIFYFPLIVVVVALLGLGFGIIISSLTTKYRDFAFLVGFGVQLMMYATPIVYPLSIVNENKQWLMALNPMTSIIELFRLGILGQGIFNPYYLIYSVVFSIVLLIIGIFIFNKVERNFMDTV